jgi:hypothetical protein
MAQPAGHLWSYTPARTKNLSRVLWSRDAPPHTPRHRLLPAESPRVICSVRRSVRRATPSLIEPPCPTTKRHKPHHIQPRPSCEVATRRPNVRMNTYCIEVYWCSQHVLGRVCLPSERLAYVDQVTIPKHDQLLPVTPSRKAYGVWLLRSRSLVLSERSCIKLSALPDIGRVAAS